MDPRNPRCLARRAEVHSAPQPPAGAAGPGTSPLVSSAQRLPAWNTRLRRSEFERRESQAGSRLRPLRADPGACGASVWHRGCRERLSSLRGSPGNDRTEAGPLAAGRRVKPFGMQRHFRDVLNNPHVSERFHCKIVRFLTNCKIPSQKWAGQLFKGP